MKNSFFIVIRSFLIILGPTGFSAVKHQNRFDKTVQVQIFQLLPFYCTSKIVSNVARVDFDFNESSAHVKIRNSLSEFVSSTSVLHTCFLALHLNKAAKIVKKKLEIPRTHRSCFLFSYESESKFFNF